MKQTTDNLAKIFAPNMSSHNTTTQETEWMTTVTRILINGARHIGTVNGELQRRMDEMTDEDASTR